MSRLRLLITMLVVLGFSVACSSTTPEESPAANNELQPGIIQATPTPIVNPDADPDTIVDLPDEQQGVLINRYDLEVQYCFNTYGIQSLEQDAQPTTTIVACREPHESEVYYQSNYPAGGDQPFPGTDAITRWTEERCYREFEGWVGQIYELSELEIGIVHPSRETWDVGNYRTITCYVYSVAGGGLIGSMSDTGI
ncbi:MAG: septum formation family protein [Acidimicrobiales bacterium]|jgi:hypothetical protein